jgi:type I restriction enzyme S subunit
MWFEENKRGTTIKGVSRNDVLRLMIPLPTLPEQQAIAGVLRRVKRAKEACEQVLAVMRQLKQSLLHHLFTYGPVPLAHAAHVPQRELESGVFPSTWVVKRFDEFATLQRGQDLARWEFKSGTVPVIGATTIIGYHDTANVKGPGVTVVRSGSSAGKPLFVERNFWAHNVVLYVKDFHGNDPKFVFYMLLVLGLTKFRSGVAVPTLNRNAFSGIQIAVPPLPEQREIAAQLSALDAKLAAEGSRLAALAALFQSLLHFLLTGRVRLPEFAGGHTAL